MVTALLQHRHRCGYSGMTLCTWHFGDWLPFSSLVLEKEPACLFPHSPAFKPLHLFKWCSTRWWEWTHGMCFSVDAPAWRQSIFLNTPLVFVWKGHLFAAPHWTQPSAGDWLSDESRAWMDPIQWREDIKCLFFSFRSFSLFFFFLQCIISWVSTTNGNHLENKNS